MAAFGKPYSIGETAETSRKSSRFGHNSAPHTHHAAVALWDAEAP
jgi:hypothetical protein